MNVINIPNLEILDSELFIYRNNRRKFIKRNCKTNFENTRFNYISILKYTR